MKNEITPTDSVCPVFIEPIDEAQLEADQNERDQRAADKQTRLNERQAILDRLGITADEAALLVS
jgi:hypothetical protein